MKPNVPIKNKIKERFIILLLNPLGKLLKTKNKFFKFIYTNCVLKSINLKF